MDENEPGTEAGFRNRVPCYRNSRVAVRTIADRIALATRPFGLCRRLSVECEALDAALKRVALNPVSRLANVRAILRPSDCSKATVRGETRKTVQTDPNRTHPT